MPPEVEEPKRTLRIEIAPQTFLWVLGLAAAVWIALQLKTVLMVITIALVLVGTIDPIVGWLGRRGIPRGYALIITFVTLAMGFAALVVLTVPELVAQLVSMIDQAPKARDHLVASLQGRPIAKPLLEALQSIPVDELTKHMGPRMLALSTELMTMIGYGISTLFLAIYLLADPVRSKGVLFAIVPRHHHIKLARVLFELKIIVGGYMRGQLITSAAIAVFVFILLTICGVDNALALALFAGVTDIIPFIGGYVASAPVIVAVSGRGAIAVVVVFALMVLYQEFESRILVPRVYGRVLRLPPAIVLVALLVGGVLMGVVGALLALPIAAGLQMMIRELRVEMPGAAPQSEATRVRDEKAEHIYDELTEGASASDAGVIASQLAERIKETEQKVAGETPGTSVGD